MRERGSAGLTLTALALFCLMATMFPRLLVAQIAVQTRSLIEVSTYPVPEGIDPVGITGSADGRIALWTGEEVFVIANDTLAPIAADAHQPFAVAAREYGWDVVDITRKAIFHYSTGNPEPQLTALVLESRPYSAARMSCGWVFQLWDAQTERGSLVLVNELGNVGWSLDVSWAARHSRSSGLLLQLVGAGDQVTATAFGFPFDVAVVDCSGDVHTFGPGPPLPAGDGWVGLGTVPIPDGFVTTHSDTRSDRRLVRRRDAQGRFLRDTSLDVPLGFAAPLGSTSILALRRTDRVEIVVYTIN